jgi:hypothetical protein
MADSDVCLLRLHAAGWSVGNATFLGPLSLVWVVVYHSKVFIFEGDYIAPDVASILSSAAKIGALIKG